MKTYLLFVLILCSTSLSASAQHEADNWYFGNLAGIKFRDGKIEVLADGKIHTKEGCAVLSDKSTGELLFYTDGMNVWNRFHNVMKNGTGLQGGFSSTQSALIVPNPADTLQYYIFTAPDLTPGTGVTGLYYSIVSLKDAIGEVISKNNVLFDGVSEKLTGTPDCSGSGFWIMTTDKNEDIFYAFHLTASGLNKIPVKSPYVVEHGITTSGYLKFSPDGSRLVSACPKRLLLFDFNAVTGEVKNCKLLKYGIQFYGVSFSPDNSKLYAIAEFTGTKSILYQYEVQHDDIDSIINSEVSVPKGKSLPIAVSTALQLGPDGKLYMNSMMNQSLSVINHPNRKGDLCEFRADVIKLSGNCDYGLPNFMDYNIGRIADTTNLCLFKNGVKIGVAPRKGFSYEWIPTDGLDNPRNSNPTVIATKIQEYKLKTTTDNGCVSTMTYPLQIDSLKLRVPIVLTVCLGSGVQLTATGGDTYSWSPTQDLDSPNKANPMATPKVNTIYKVISTRGCCIDSAFVNVIIKPPLRANAGKDKIICKVGSVQIGDSAKSNEMYSWTPEDGLDNTTIANPIASPKKTTTYILTTKRDDCVAYDTVTVTILTIKAVVSKDVTVCKGNRVRLWSSGGSTYSWSPSEGIDNPSLQNPIASPVTTTRYKVTVTDGDCVDSGFVTVTVVPSLKAIAGEDRTITCAGESTELGAAPEPNMTYSWSPTTGLDDPTKANPIASPTTTTKYRVRISNGNCADSAFVTVHVTPFSGADAGIDKTICPGASTRLGSAGVDGNTYSWQPTTGLDDPTKANPMCILASGSMRYILTVIAPEGCIAYDTVQVAIGDIIAKASNDTAICFGSNAKLMAWGGSEYAWTPTTGLDDPSIPNPTASPSVTTTYKVTVSSGACQDFKFVTVTVNPSPTANAGMDKFLCMGDSIQLGAPQEDGVTYLWLPATDLDDASKSNPTASPISNTTYIVTATNSTGCVGRDTVLVSVMNTNALVSSDVEICEGVSTKLSASGGSTYVWSPIDGLDNPAIATPTASPGKTTRYTVIVSNGTCSESASVTVTVNPLPVANAGPDVSLCIGESIELGESPLPENTYSWQPIEGLDNPSKSNPIASPTTPTKYILTVTTNEGCVARDTVIIGVNPINEHLFTLSPQRITILPGELFKTILHIPDNIQSWKVHFDYNNLVVKFNSVIQTPSWITAEPIDSKGNLTLQGTGGNGDVHIGFDVFLPYNADTSFAMNLTADTTAIQPCENLTTLGNTLVLGMFCGRVIRTVSSTGKNYFLTSNQNGVNFGVGLTGRVRLELYDYTGTLKEVLADGNLEAGEYTLDFDSPTGLYFCKMSAGMYNDVQKILITNTR